MEPSYFALSPKQRELMELLWAAGQPLSRLEILERSAQMRMTWKPNSIHILLNFLMDKGAVQAAGFYMNNRKLGRLYEPAITKEDYCYLQVRQAVLNAQKLGLRAPDMLPALLGYDLQALEEMEQYVKSLRKEKLNQKKQG